MAAPLPDSLLALVKESPPIPQARLQLQALLDGDLESGARAYVRSGLWHVWREIVRFRGLSIPEGVEELRRGEEASFALWAFDNGLEEEGDFGYRLSLQRHVREKHNDPETNVLFLDHRLRLGQFEEVIATVKRIEDEHDFVPDEIMRAVRAHLALGQTDEATKKLTAIRARNLDSGEIWAFTAIASKKTGDLAMAAVAQEECVRLGIFDEALEREFLDSLGISPTEWEVLRQNYKFPALDWEAAARTWWRNPGATLKPTSAPSSHWFGGEDYRMPACPGCGLPIRQWFLLDIRAIEPLAKKLPRWSAFPLLGCVECGVWMGRHDYAVDPERMEVRLLNVAISTKDYGERFRESPKVPPIPTQFVRLEWFPPRTYPDEEEPDTETPWNSLHLGGSPYWVQLPQDYYCPQCRRKMVFVAAMTSTTGFEPYIPINNESGFQYHWACNDCGILSVIAQWT
ncbi:MAG: tetratricopeptide repeat protein [Gemmataceae bacterium]|nr:tetratricopeptide repeat protein [Gemmataceae bacterium]